MRMMLTVMMTTTMTLTTTKMMTSAIMTMFSPFSYPTLFLTLLVPLLSYPFLHISPPLLLISHSSSPLILLLISPSLPVSPPSHPLLHLFFLFSFFLSAGSSQGVSVSIGTGGGDAKGGEFCLLCPAFMIFPVGFVQLVWHPLSVWSGLSCLVSPVWLVWFLRLK